MADGIPRPAIIPAVTYTNADKALEWLEKAFGFETFMVIRDPGGNNVHAEMRVGDGVVMIGNEWSEDHKSPKNVGGKNTQSIHVHIREDIDAHCRRARAAGAAIVMEPEDQFYGDRTYRARDLEGHIWSFGQPVRAVSRKDAEKTSGLSIEAKDWV